jgi:WD40 repeat protein
VWSINGGPAIQTLKGHDDMILCLAIAPNAEWIVSGSVDRTVKVNIQPHPSVRPLSLIPTVTGNTVRSLFSTHGQLSAAQGSSTTVSRSD